MRTSVEATIRSVERLDAEAWQNDPSYPFVRLWIEDGEQEIYFLLHREVAERLFTALAGALCNGEEVERVEQEASYV